MLHQESTQSLVHDGSACLVAFFHVRKDRRGGVKQRQRSDARTLKPPISASPAACRADVLDVRMLVFDPVGALFYSYRPSVDRDRFTIVFGPSPIGPPVPIQAVLDGETAHFPALGVSTGTEFVAASREAETSVFLHEARVPNVVASFPVDVDTTPAIAINAIVRQLFAQRQASPEDDTVMQEFLVDTVVAMGSPADRTYFPAEFMVNDDGVPLDENRGARLVLDLTPALGAILPNPFFGPGGERTGRVAAVRRAHDAGATDEEIDAAILGGPGAPLIAAHRPAIQVVDRESIRGGCLFGQLVISPLALPESAARRNRPRLVHATR